MSAPANVPLTIYQGSTFRKSVTWMTGDPAAPVDLTGATARMQIRKKVTAEEVLCELTTENDGIVLGGEDGTITLYIPDDATEDFSFASGVYDLEIIMSNGDVRRLMEGAVTVKPEVTRGV